MFLKIKFSIPIEKVHARSSQLYFQFLSSEASATTTTLTFLLKEELEGIIDEVAGLKFITLICFPIEKVSNLLNLPQQQTSSNWR